MPDSKYWASSPASASKVSEWFFLKYNDEFMDLNIFDVF